LKTFLFSSLFSYKKQSSGKDLSSRTNNELDCIFGWNKTNQININEIKQQSDEEKVFVLFCFSFCFIFIEKESETTSDNLYTTSKKSIHDYFKEKSYKKAQRLYQQTESNQINSGNKFYIDKIYSFISKQKNII